MGRSGVITNYDEECTAGRALARAVIAGVKADPDTLPAMVAGIRRAVLDETGVGVGYLYAISAAAIGRTIPDFN